jgi:hypothetical protein
MSDPSPVVRAALGELGDQLRQPGTVDKAIRAYVLAEAMQAVAAADPDGEGAVTVAVSTKREDRDGGALEARATTSHCTTTTYTILGVDVYSTTVCESTTVPTSLRITVGGG